jgi:hypothetical protein
LLLKHNKLLVMMIHKQKTAKPKSDVKNSNLAFLKETITYFLHIL